MSQSVRDSKPRSTKNSQRLYNLEEQERLYNQLGIKPMAEHEKSIVTPQEEDLDEDISPRKSAMRLVIRGKIKRLVDVPKNPVKGQTRNLRRNRSWRKNNSRGKGKIRIRRETLRLVNPKGRDRRSSKLAVRKRLKNPRSGPAVRLKKVW